MKVFPILVTYFPSLKILGKTLNSLLPQVDKIFIVDNTPNKASILEGFRSKKIEIIYLMQNSGIAHAQNVGIRRAINEGADYVILSDQDTVYPPNYVSEMLKCFSDEKVIAAGPVFVNTHTGKRQFFVTLGKLGFKKIYPDSGKYEILQLIASGTMIKTKAFERVDLMREDFFIDWVDMEWCWRAVKKGYKIIGNADVVVYHQHGNDSKKLFGKDITIKTPIRYYYTIRNGIYLALHTDLLNLFLRYLLFIKTFRNAFIYPLLIKPHFKSLKYSLLGLYHGIKGKLGNLNEPH